MKVTLDIGPSPFPVPDTISARLPQSGQNPLSARLPDFAFPLSAFDPATLDKLCCDFRETVFAKAGSKYPPEPIPTGIAAALRNIVNTYDASSAPVDASIADAIEAARGLL